MYFGRTGRVDRITSMAEKTVTVGKEVRGPDWGKGRAKAEFDRIREENARIPLSQRTQRELEEVAGEQIRSFYREVKAREAAKGKGNGQH